MAGTRGRTRGSALPVLPCFCLALGFAALTATLLCGAPGASDELSFVGGVAHNRAAEPKTVRHGNNEDGAEWMAMRRQKRRSVLDRGTDEYKKQSEQMGRVKEAVWEAANTRSSEKDGGDIWGSVGDNLRKREEASAPSPPAFEMPSFEMPSFTMPSLGQPQSQNYGAPSPASSPVAQPAGDSNPFQFIADFFNPTTTTTTTTLPPNPFEQFLSGLGLR